MKLKEILSQVMENIFGSLGSMAEWLEKKKDKAVTKLKSIVTDSIFGIKKVLFHK